VTNLATVLTNTAQARPDAPALKFMGHDIGYGPLAGMAAKVAGALRENGIQPGDRVAIILPNVPAFPVVFWGILLAGGTVVPMNPLLKAGEIDYFFSDSGAKVAFVWPDFVDEATKGAANAGTRIIPCGPMGPADGTLEGGEPIAEAGRARRRGHGDHPLHVGHDRSAQGRRTHPQQRPPQRRAIERVDPRGQPDDVVMGCLPLFHVFGLVVGLVAATTVGASLALIPRFDPGEAIKVISNEKVTIFQGVPTMYAAILNHPEADAMDATSLRACASGGSAMPLEVMRGFEEKFGCMVLEGYGLSETSPGRVLQHARP
jgi:long-chain acyl-CoA synthetase